MAVKTEAKSEEEARRAEAEQAEAERAETEGPVDDGPVDDGPVDLELAASGIVRRYMYWSAGAGLIPVPLVDAAALIAVQVRMLQQLSHLYGIPFQENAVKAAVGSLLATASAQTLGFSAFSLMMRFVPVVGMMTAALTKPFFAGAFTYAVGKVFNQHFASGGTFLTFDPKKVESYFNEKFAEGRAEMRGATRAAA